VDLRTIMILFGMFALAALFFATILPVRYERAQLHPMVPSTMHHS
jgi:FtsZ-interacting cell division protein ZipA